MLRKIVFLLVLLGMTLHGHGDDASWKQWLGKLAGDISVERADLIIEIMAALDQEHRVVSEPRQGTFNCGEHSVATAVELTEFAKKVGSWMNCAYTGIYAEYRADIKGVKLVGNLHDDVVILGIGTDVIQNPELIKAQICLRLAALTINWNMVCQDKPENWQLLAVEVMAICKGFGEVLLNSIETRKTVSGNSVTYHSTTWMRLTATEIAWTIAALDILRGKEPQLNTNTDLGKIARERGFASVKLNYNRIRDLTKAHKDAIENAKEVVIPPHLAPWFENHEPIACVDIPKLKLDPIAIPELIDVPTLSTRRAKKDASDNVGTRNNKVARWHAELSKRARYDPPKDEVFEAACDEAKRILSRKNGGGYARPAAVEKLAYSKLSPDESHYFLFRNSFSKMVHNCQWRKAERLFTDEVKTNGFEVALAAIEDVKTIQKKLLSRDAISLQEKIAATKTSNEKIRNYEQAECKLLTKSQHEEAGHTYLTIGEYANAAIALKCADPARAEIMDAICEGRISGDNKFAWLMPRSMEVANFWYAYGNDKNADVQSACRHIASEWYEKALKRSLVSSRTPDWVLQAKRRLEWCKQFSTWRNRPYLHLEFTFKSGSIAGYCRVPVLKNATQGESVVSSYIDVVRSRMGVTLGKEKWFCPSVWWLARMGAHSWQCKVDSKNSVRITIVKAIANLPLSDIDFDNSPSKCPTGENLQKAFSGSKITGSIENWRNTWLSKYYNIPENKVTLKQLTWESGRTAYLVILNDESSYGLWIQMDSRSGVFADFTVIGTGVIKESFFRRFAERVTPI